MRQLVNMMISTKAIVFVVTAILVGASILPPTFSVAAQSSNESNIEIVSINTENLPEIVLLMKGTGAGEDFVTAPITLTEDGTEQPIIAEDLSQENLQIAFVMDPTQNLVAPGNTGDARWFEIASAASGLVQSGILSAQTDLLAAYGPNQEADGFGLLDGWLRDHQAVVNTMYQFQPNEATVESLTANVLSDALIETLNGFAGEESTEEAERIVVVFSDGSQLLNTERVNQVIDLAEELSVQLNVVMLGADTPIARGNLERLSTGTNGQFQVLNDMTDLDVLWSAWQQQRTVREITYRLDSADASEIEVSIDSDGQQFTATAEYPEFDFEPAEIEITSPVASETISFDLTDGMTEDDVSIPISLEITWPDERSREIAEVDYLIDGTSVAQQRTDLDELQLPLAEIENGDYALSIAATDELGIEAVTSAVNVTLAVIRPSVEQSNSSSADTTNSVSDSTADDAMGDSSESATTNADALVSTTSSDAASDTDSTASNNDSTESSSDVANAALDAALNEPQSESTRGSGMNLFGIELPPQVEIFGVPFLINPVTLLIAAFPLIFALALLTYWLSQRSNTKATYATDYDFYDIGQVPTIENNIYFEDDGQLQVTQPQIGIIDIEDDITEPVKVPSFYTSAPAYLVYVSGGNHLPKKLPIEGHDPIRIGRKKSFCELVLDDRRVSRLHSVISAIDGEFYIRDEGSSGGTFVNRRKLGTVDNQKLNHNDIINFNEVEYRFESTTEVSNGSADATSSIYAPPIGSAES